MTLVNTIRRLRFEKDETTQAELANAIGVTRQTIYFIEKGKVMPSVMIAFKIAQYFNTTVDQVFFVKS